MEQSASIFHFHTATACQRLYFSFITRTQQPLHTEPGRQAGGREREHSGVKRNNRKETEKKRRMTGRG